MHTTTGRWRLGLTLTLVTVMMWTTLPIALKLLLETMDAYTVTWYRFVVAAILLGLWLAQARRLPRPRQMRRNVWLLLGIAAIGLTGNYVFYLLGLDLVSPGTAQIVIQLAPMFLMLGGLFVFRERFVPAQWMGFTLIIAGLALFFHDRWGDLSLAGDYGLGVAFVVVASLTWACYALAQKQLLRALPSDAIMWIIYLAGVVMFFPPSDLPSLFDLDGLELALLGYGCVNTLVAYGCFAEALNHWEASRVSAVLAVVPLLTIGCMAALAALAPGLIEPENLDALSILGAVVVVAGSGLTAFRR